MVCFAIASNLKWISSKEKSERSKQSTTSQILTIRRINKGVGAKNLEATLLFVDFSKVFDSMYRGKREQILLAYSLPKVIVTDIMILNRNTKVKARSPDGDTVARILQGNTLSPNLFIVCLDYVLRPLIYLIKENGLILKKAGSRRYPVETITDADYADDLALLAQAEFLQYSLEQAAGGIGRNMNANKMEYMCFNQERANGDPQKLEDNFKYLGSSVSSTKNDVNIHQAKARAAIDRFSIIRMSDLSD